MRLLKSKRVAGNSKLLYKKLNVFPSQKHLFYSNLFYSNKFFNDNMDKILVEVLERYERGKEKQEETCASENKELTVEEFLVDLEQEKKQKN